MPEKDDGAAQGGGPGEELLFKAKVGEIFEAELQRRLKGMKLLIGAFIGGFAIFIGAGITWKDNLLRPVIEEVYPTGYIAGKVKAELLADPQFKEARLTEEHKRAISEQIARSLSEHVDSGYTKTIVFSERAPADDNFLIFYARPEQEVEVTILATATVGTEAKFRVTLSGRAWGEPRAFPYTMVQGTITEHLRFDAEPGANLHVLRFQPIDFLESDRAVIQCVVLVRNASA